MLLSVKKGAVVIDTRLNTQKIENDFKKLDKKTQSLINKYNKSVDSIKSQELAITKVKNRLDELVSGNKTPTSIKNLETQLKNTEKEITELEKKYNETIDKINQSEVDMDFAKGLGNAEEVSNIQIEQGNLDTQSLELATQLENARDKADKLKISLQQAKLNPGSSEEAQVLNEQLNNLNSKLSQTKDEANQVKEELEEAFDQKKNVFNLEDGFDDMGKKIDKFKKKMSRLISTAMVFSLLRNSLTSLRNGFISLLKTDDQFSNSLNQIKANLMTAFAPIYNAVLPAINSLMNALSKVTGTIAMFVANLFGTSIEDATNQAKGLTKALDDTKKSGEDASGSLASFDKLEVVNDNSSASSQSGSGSVDYSGEIQYSSTLLNILNNIKDFVVENKELIIGFLMGVAGGIMAIKLGCQGIMALGIGLAISGIVILIQGIINFMNDPTWENFSTILTGLALILAGVAVAMLAVNAANPVAWIVLAIAAVIALVAIIIKYWDEICDVLGKAGQWFYDTVIKPIADFFVGMWNGLVDGAKSAWQGIMDIFSVVASFFKSIFSNAWNGVKKVFSTGGKIFAGIKDGIVKAFTGIVNTIIGGINKVVAIPFNAINTALKKIRDISFLGISPFKGLIKTITVPQIPKLATGAVIPPRQEFMAILGDQKHGTNIEAPLDTIKQANREVMQEFLGSLMGLNNNEREIVFKNLTIVAQFGNKDFSKIVVEAVRLAEKELGKPLFVN